MTHIFHRQPRSHVDVELLSAYLDNQVTPAERARVEAHLRVCATCQAELNSLRQTVTLLRALPRVPVPRAFTLSEAQAGIRQRAARWGWSGGLLRGLAAVTAVILVVVVAGNLLRQTPWASRQYLAWQAETTAIPAAPMLAAPREGPAAVAEVAPAESGEEATPLPVPAEVASASARAEETRASAAALPTTTEVPVEAPAVARAAEEAMEIPTPERRLALAPSAAVPAPDAGAAGMGIGLGSTPADLTATGGAPVAEPLPPAAPIAAILPTGAGLAYTDQNGLWVIDRDAGIRQVVQGTGLTMPLISHDRSWIAYRVQQQGGWELWAVRWDGSDPHLLLAERELPADGLEPGFGARQLHALQWIPGRLTLAVTTIALPVEPEGAPRFDLWHQEAVSGTLVHVRQMSPGEIASYSPDGSFLAVLSPGGQEDPEGRLTLFDGDGRNGRVLLRFVTPGSELQAQMQWLPDGSGLLVAVADSGMTSAHGEAGMVLYRVSVAGEVRALGRIRASALSWSPDGRWLAYLQPIEDTSGEAELIVAEADGSQARAYDALRAGGFIAWSPDGQRFLYWSAGQLYFGAVDQQPQWIGSQVTIFHPRWISPAQVLYLQEVPAGSGGAVEAGWGVISRAVSGEAHTMAILPFDVSLDVSAVTRF